MKVYDRSYPTRLGSWPDKMHQVHLGEIINKQKVCDVGCGVGRVAGLFHEDRYVGIDTDAEAIREARDCFPFHTFRLWRQGRYPTADIYLFQTVLQHIPNEQVPDMLARTNGNVLIVEYMHPWIRARGAPTSHHRSEEVYRMMMHNLFGVAAKQSIQMETKYQIDPKQKMVLTFLEFECESSE
jgi:SAM-dependent methyltransferase